VTVSSGARARRALLLAAMAAATTAIWTGAPLLALWVGSRAQRTTQPSMGAVLLVLATLVVACAALVRLLAVLSAAHDRLVGHRRGRRQAPWLRSLRGERPHAADLEPVGAPERVLVGSVVLGVLAFEAWFFFLSGSSLPAG
jgi:hypothetical protein